MSDAGKTRKAALFQGRSLLVFALAAWAFYLSSYQVYLCLDNPDTHTPLFWTGVKANDSFSLAYRCPPRSFHIEHYRIVHGRWFVLTGITFKGEAAPPNPLPGINRFKPIGNGWRTLQTLHKRMKKIPFVMGVSHRSNVTLVIHERRFPLKDRVLPGTPVELRVIRTRKFYGYVWRIEKWLKAFSLG